MERLRRRTDFRAAAEAGARAPAKAFVLQARARHDDGGENDKDKGPVRVGFTVSRQVGNAVERNRVRRRLREMVRLTTEGKLNSGHDYVLIGRRTALQAPFGDLMADFDAALRRVHAARPRQTGTRTGAAQQRPPHKAGPRRPRPSHPSGDPSGQKPKREPEIEC